MALNELDLIIKVRSDLQKSMKEADKALKKLEKDTGETTQKMEMSFKSVGNAIQVAMGSMVIKAGADAIKTAEKTAISFNILKARSSDVADQLERTSEVTFGLANKFDMVNAANKAMAFGIDLSNGRLEKLMKMSSKTAMVMGTDVKSAFDDLITGTARESKMILDNLGVMVNLNEVYTNYADSVGLTATQLTKQQRQTALLDEVNRQLEKSTNKVTDAMIKQSTQGTRATKTIETAWTKVKNMTAQAVVTLGEKIGEGLARAEVYGNESLTNMEEKYQEFANNTDGVYNWTFEQFKAWKKKEDAYESERLKKGINSLIEFEDSKLKIKKWYYADDINAFKEQQKIIDNIQKNEENKFGMENYVLINGRYIPKSQVKLEKDTSGALLKHKSLVIAKNEKKDKEEAKKIISLKKSIILEIIELDKEAMGYAKAGYVKKLQMDKEYANKKNEYIKYKLSELGNIRREYASSLDKFNKTKDEIEIAKNNNNALLASEKSFNDAVLELARRNAAQRKIISLDEYKARKKIKEQQEKESLAHFNLLKRFGSEYLDAIIEGNASKIPEILSQQAKMFGQELIWDGIKTLWMGNAKNAMFPGLGVSATTVGLAEIGIGTGIAGAGMALGAAIATPDNGAKERNTTASQNSSINLNTRVSLYGSETESRRRINDLLMGA